MIQPNEAQKRKVKNFKNNEPEIYQQVLQEQGQPESHKDYSSFIMALWLLDQAEQQLKPKKLDRFAFPYDNLSERYRSKSKRLHKIQRLVRHTEIEARQRIEELLNQ